MLLVALIVGASEASALRIEPWNKRCLKDYAVWKKKPSRKAVAITRAYANGQGCGMSWSYESSAGARTEALRRCMKQLRRNRPGSKDQCRVIEMK